MAYNRFVLNATSYHGKGAIQAIPEIVKSKGFHKAFVASDPGLVKFGVTAKVTEAVAVVQGRNTLEGLDTYDDVGFPGRAY